MFLHILIFIACLVALFFLHKLGLITGFARMVVRSTTGGESKFVVYLLTFFIDVIILVVLAMALLGGGESTAVTQ